MALTLAVFVGLLTASVLVVRREGLRREAQLQEQGLELLESSLHDPLTGLANRRGLQVLLERAIARFNADRSNPPLAENDRAKRVLADDPLVGNPLSGGTPESDVLAGEMGADLLVICLIDLDDFKPVNDRYGHAVGDQLLVEVGRRLCQCLRTLPVNLTPEPRLRQGSDQTHEARAGRLALAGERGLDQVARLGGDEFVCILAGCSSPSQVEGLAQRILHSLGQPFALERHSLTVGASLGIAWTAGSQAPSPLTLLQVADHAMYGAKARGKNHYQLEEILNPGDLSSPELRPRQADIPGFP
jgi:GGDEF domain-containing protein